MPTSAPTHAVTGFAVTRNQVVEGIAPTNMTFVFTPAVSHDSGKLQIDASHSIFKSGVAGATCTATQEGASPAFAADQQPDSATRLSLALTAKAINDTITIACVAGSANPFAVNPSSTGGAITFMLTWTDDSTSTAGLAGYTPILATAAPTTSPTISPTLSPTQAPTAASSGAPTSASSSAPTSASSNASTAAEG